MKGPLGAGGAGTKVPAGGCGLGGLGAKIVEGLGLFKCDLARIHMVQEATKASKRMTKSMPKASARREGERHNRSSSSSVSSSWIMTCSLDDTAALSTCCCVDL